MTTANDYLPILIQAGVAMGFVVAVLFGTHFLGPRLKSKTKDANFECGVEQEGNARFPVSVRYFLTAILFVLFDVEVIFFYPYAVNFKALELEGLLAVIMFVAFFLIGFIYVLKKGALEWEK
jgi:NADH-quinone oxidoreductase subunit A